jgi:hypothetical protein
MPVAAVVAIVMLGDMAVFTQTVGLEEGADAELAAFTVIAGLVVTLKFSTEGTNTEFALPAPAPVAVKVAVAVPAAWIVVCAPDSVPFTAPLKVMGCPTRAVRLAGAMASLRLLVRKLAVIVEVPPTQMDDGDAVLFRFSQRVGAVPKIADADGPLLTPHQLLSKFIVPIVPPAGVITFPLATPAELLLTRRLKLMLTVCAVTIATAAPPKVVPLDVLFTKLFLRMLTKFAPVPPKMLIAPP